MASMRMVEQLEEQPPAKKPRIDNSKEQGKIVNSNELNLAKSTEQKDEESKTAATIMDLPIRRLLPLEMNCEIFKCLKWPIQTKFIWGLGQGIYGIFGQKVLIKSKRLRNPQANHWDDETTSEDGLNVSNDDGWTYVFAAEGFPISGVDRGDNFPGTIVYYYEITQTTQTPGGTEAGPFPLWIGLSDRSMPEDAPLVGHYPNSYSYPPGSDYCNVAGDINQFKCSADAEGIITVWNGLGDVAGCGILVDPDGKLAIFFTLNGKLIDRQVPVSPSVDRLFPAIEMFEIISLEANFGNDPAKPFKFDIENCPGL